MNAIGILITIWNDLRLAFEVAYIYLTKGETVKEDNDE